MKQQAETLFRAIGAVGDDLIARADEPVKKAPRIWVKWAALAACCVLGFGVYQAGLIDQMSPAAQSGESIGASSGVTAYAAPAPGEDEETSGAAATLPAPEEA